MKCPECGMTKDLKWFLRHVSKEEDDTSEYANAITILCTKCGKNQTYLLEDCLEDIFPEWRSIDIPNLESIFAGNFKTNFVNEEIRND